MSFLAGIALVLSECLVIIIYTVHNPCTILKNVSIVSTVKLSVNISLQNYRMKRPAAAHNGNAYVSSANCYDFEECL